MSIFNNRHLKFGQLIVWLGCVLIQIASAIPIDNIFVDTVSIVHFIFDRDSYDWLWIWTRDYENEWYLLWALLLLLLCVFFWILFNFAWMVEWSVSYYFDYNLHYTYQLPKNLLKKTFSIDSLKKLWIIESRFCFNFNTNHFNIYLFIHSITKYCLPQMLLYFFHSIILFISLYLFLRLHFALCKFSLAFSLFKSSGHFIISINKVVKIYFWWYVCVFSNFDFVIKWHIWESSGKLQFA